MTELDTDLWVRKVEYTVRRPSAGWPQSSFMQAIAYFQWQAAAEALRAFYRARGVF